MRHKVIVGVTQLLALLIGISISYGIATIVNSVGCMGGGYGFCLLDTVVITAMGAVAVVAFAFAMLLFRAYVE